MTMRRRGRRRAWRGAIRWLRDQLTARPASLWVLCVGHVLALGIALVLYALPHHVIPHGEVAVGVVSTRGGAVSAQAIPAEATRAPEGRPAEADVAVSASLEEGGEQAAAPEPDGEDAEPAGDSAESSTGGRVEEDAAALEALFGTGAVGSFRDTFDGVFTDGEVERTEDTYRSANVCVRIQEKYVEEMNAWVYVADIYVADISCLTTAFSEDRYGRGYTEWITDIAGRYDSVVTLNGDYYGSRSTGVIIRNGELYRDSKHKGDICVLYWDGHMETFKSSRFNTMDEMARGAYQSWSFGPSLLDESGKPLGDFNCDNYLRNRHPRSAIGYFEPGHYCFVAVDGRNDDSKGATLTQLATIMSRLGCKQGYNLDGGQTSLLAAGTKMINHPSQGGRNSSDYIMIVDRVTQ